MVCRPASQMIMWNPTACQIDMNMIAGIAVVGLFNQSVPCECPKVTAEMIWFIATRKSRAIA